MAVDSFAVPPTDDGLPGKGHLRRTDILIEFWTQRRPMFARQREQEKGAFVFFGDSLTQGWEDLPALLFPGMKIANRGINADTTRGMLYRVNEDVVSLDPAGVMLMMGTNDLKDEITPEDIATNVGLIVAELKKHNPAMPIVLCQLMPSTASRGRPAEKVQELNERYRQLADGDPQITLIDAYTPFANAEGECDPAEFPDLLHPNEQAYRRFAETLRPVFIRIGQLPA